MLRLISSDGGLHRAFRVLRLMYNDGGLHRAFRVLRFIYIVFGSLTRTQSGNFIIELLCTLNLICKRKQLI